MDFIVFVFYFLHKFFRIVVQIHQQLLEKKNEGGMIGGGLVQKH